MGSGVCLQNGKVVFSSQVSPRSLVLASPLVLCVDPLPGNIKIVRNITRTIFGSESDAPLKAVHAAVSDHTGSVSFPDASAGSEGERIGRDCRNNNNNKNNNNSQQQHHQQQQQQQRQRQRKQQQQQQQKHVYDKPSTVPLAKVNNEMVTNI